jgi:RNA polymerase sigma-70 factor (ECF subfamily)
MEVKSQLTDKANRDLKLIQRAINQKDQNAYAELMGLYKETIYFMMLKMTNNSDDADDLTIEAFGKAFKNIHNYTPEFAFSTWLFKIATNNCIDFIRKKKLNTTSIDHVISSEDSPHPSRDVISSGKDPEEKIIEKQKIQLMQEVVEKLKPRYKDLVKMRYFEEMSYEEISQELNLPVNTVKVQLFRARDLLYQIIKNAENVI